jgi:hypothetical protein
MCSRQDVQIIRSGFGCRSVYPYSSARVEDPRGGERIAAIGHSKFPYIHSLYRYHDWLSSSNPVVQILCVVYLQLVFIRRLYPPIAM